MPVEQGFTIAVLGEWGSGKTSVMNMVAETLEDDLTPTAVIRFNPWLFSNADDLVARFFRELSAQLGQREFKGLKDVLNAFTKLGQSLAPLSPVPGTTVIATVVALLTKIFNRPSSLLKIRGNLTKALSKSSSRIVVLIDDIDRLEIRETRELMRLVRLTSDLPNIVYLLAFDRRHVAKSLRDDEAEGLRYLDKIVQISYDIPTLRKQILGSTLFRSLDNVIQQGKLAELDKEVWQRVYFEIVRPLLRTMRDVKRYTNALPTTFDIIGEEVALADVLGLEALRILKPRLFDTLKAQADNLVDTDSPSGLGKPQEIRDKEAKEALQEMLERAGDDREVLRSVLEILFPVTHKSLGRGWLGPSPISTWRAQRRVACKEVLQVYFEAGLGEGALETRQIRRLIEALINENKLAILLDELEAEQFEEALGRLSDYEREFPTKAATSAVPVFVNRMGRLSGNTPRILHVPPRSKIYHIVRVLLQKIADTETFSESMLVILGKVTLLSGRLALIAMVGYRDRVGKAFVDKNQAAMMEEQLAQQLLCATSQQLTEEWDLYSLSWGVPSWLEGEKKHQLITKLRDHLRNDNLVLSLFRSSVSYASHNSHVEKRLYWDDLSETYGEELIESATRLACSKLYDELTPDDQDTVKLAQRYASGWRPTAWCKHLC